MNARSVLSSDRKSTRLNSSHSQISYAVFCLKKKPVGEMRLHRVAADRLEGQDVDILLAGLQDFLARSVATHFSRRGVHAQEFVGQLETAAVGKRNLEHPGFLVQLDFGRSRSVRRRHEAF